MDNSTKMTKTAAFGAVQRACANFGATVIEVFAKDEPSQGRTLIAVAWRRGDTEGTHRGHVEVKPNGAVAASLYWGDHPLEPGTAYEAARKRERHSVPWAAVDWLSEEVKCPGCGQVITEDAGKLECGGVGEGICAAAAYVFDVAADLSPGWEGSGDPPSEHLQARIIQTFEEATCPD